MFAIFLKTEKHNIIEILTGNPLKYTWTILYLFNHYVWDNPSE